MKLVTMLEKIMFKVPNAAVEDPSEDLVAWLNDVCPLDWEGDEYTLTFYNPDGRLDLSEGDRFFFDGTKVVQCNEIIIETYQQAVSSGNLARHLLLSPPDAYDVLDRGMLVTLGERKQVSFRLLPCERSKLKAEYPDEYSAFIEPDSYEISGFVVHEEIDGEERLLLKQKSLCLFSRFGVDDWFMSANRRSIQVLHSLGLMSQHSYKLGDKDDLYLLKWKSQDYRI